MVPSGRSVPSLRRELLLSTAVLFVAALLIAVAATSVTLPLLSSPAQSAFFIAILIAIDLGILFLFLSSLFRSSLFGPLESIGADAERIASGEFEHRIAYGNTIELDRLSRSLNTMAERLISDQERLAESVRTLDQTNRDLMATTDDLVRSARMASVGTLAAGLAHEVGNPLGALVGYLDVVKGRIASGGEIRPLIVSALEEADRIDRIVKSVLDFADGGNERSGRLSGAVGVLSHVSLSEIVERTLGLLEGRGGLAGVEVRKSIDEGSFPVLARAQHLEQILMNLFMNALRAAREGGSPPEISLRIYTVGGAKEGGSWVALEVSDNGPGIREENLERVFDPFFTTHPPGEGTGLGLAITSRIVRELGGRIRAMQPDTGGALFRLTLPLAGPEMGSNSVGDPDAR